jgi:uncharacterized protein YjdB
VTGPDAGPDQRVIATLRMLAPQVAMGVDERARLLAFPEDADGGALANVPVSWTSDAPQVVSVDDSGAVAAHEFGTARITASAGGLSAVTAVTVTRAGITGLHVEPAQAFLSVGERLELGVVEGSQSGAAKIPRIVVWESSDPSVATVSPFGEVRPVAPGKVAISARHGDFRAVAGITVVAARVAQVTLAPLTLAIEPGAAEPLKALAVTARGTPLPDLVIAWQSSDPQVALVDGYGNVRALKIGVAKVTASCGGVRAVATVRVMARKPPTRS